MHRKGFLRLRLPYTYRRRLFGDGSPGVGADQGNPAVITARRLNRSGKRIEATREQYDLVSFRTGIALPCCKRNAVHRSSLGHVVAGTTRCLQTATDGAHEVRVGLQVEADAAEVEGHDPGEGLQHWSARKGG